MVVSFKQLAALGVFFSSAVAAASSSVNKRGTTTKQPPPVASVSCNGQSYVYHGLAGFGSVPSDARDQYGDTISIGSSMTIKNWKKKGNKYTGTLYGLPDRGWNTNGTQNTVPRLHVFDITFTPPDDATTTATVANPSKPNLQFAYKRTILLSGPDGKRLTGLDPDIIAGDDALSYPGFPPRLPTATYPGDGFGGSGPGDKRIALDAEGLVVLDDGSFFISDEYGPFLYKFSPEGRMVAAVAPPDAILPVRGQNGNQISYNSNTPPIYDPSQVPDPEDPVRGRQNNQGFEGLTMSADGTALWVMLQSAAQQEGGASAPTRRNARFLKYAVHNNNKNEMKYEAEYVVPLPTYANAKGKTRVAAQSEILYVSDTQFLVLPRDSGAGRGQDDPLSRYRHVDVVDIAGATDIKGTGRFDDIRDGNLTEGGDSDELVAGVKPATLCPFLDYNVNSELNKFATAQGDVVHNGAPVDTGLLNEKWEALALVPVNPNPTGGRGKKDCKDEYYLFTLSDNDFVTNNGYINFGKIQYVDDSATVPFLDSQALVFKVTLPKGSRPFVG